MEEMFQKEIPELWRASVAWDFGDTKVGSRTDVF